MLFTLKLFLLSTDKYVIKQPPVFNWCSPPRWDPCKPAQLQSAVVLSFGATQDHSRRCLDAQEGLSQ